MSASSSHPDKRIEHEMILWENMHRDGKLNLKLLNGGLPRKADLITTCVGIAPTTCHKPYTDCLHLSIYSLLPPHI